MKGKVYFVQCMGPENAAFMRVYKLTTNTAPLVAACIYLGSRIIKSTYIHNSNMWYTIFKEETDYYDIDNNKIYDKEFVTYRGEKYQVLYDRQQQEWQLLSIVHKEKVPLKTSGTIEWE